jgi:L-methionine (R)-S-oxide reductase
MCGGDIMDFKELLLQAQSILEDQPNQQALLANASAFIYQSIPDLNWAGFYLFDGQKLTVGPFQGLVACHTIQLGHGVCGEVAQTLKTKIVDDVLSHDNHIACDANSRSEIVLPLLKKGNLFGVLDIDSPIYHRFDAPLAEFLEQFVEILAKLIDN